MEEIQVGEYVRTKDGYIRKVVARDVDNHIVLDILWGKYRWVTKIEEQEKIKKHSFNIIDLIEVGDYVNGEEITYINKKGILTSDNYELDMFEDLTRKEFTNEDIKSVVTHEQFENIKYVVGDE